MSSSISRVAHTVLSGLIASGSTRTRLTSISIAHAIAYELELPIQYTDHPKGFILEQADYYQSFLNKLLDRAPIDLDTIEALVVQWFDLRVKQTFNPPVLTSTDNSIYDTYYFTTCFSMADIETIANPKSGFKELSATFRMIAREYKESQNSDRGA